MQKAIIVKAEDYSHSIVENALNNIFSEYGGIDSILKPGMNVFIKANLVREMKPEEAATTHPMVIQVLSEMLIRHGINVTVGDSSGGAYTISHMNAVYKTTGMKDACNNSGAKLNDDFTSQILFNENGMVLKQIQVTNSFMNADAVINVCKLKTHGLTGYSGAVKNLFGLIPGLVKVEMHSKFNTIDSFCNCLIDIERFASPKIVLHIIDGIIGMDGNGPTNGHPKKIGVMIASQNAYVADMYAISLFSEPLDNPIIKTAKQRNIINVDEKYINGIKEITKPYYISDFDKVDITLTPSFFVNMPGFLKSLFKNNMSRKVKINKKICIGCGKCKMHCPGKAIEITKKKAEINQNKCIRCYCCQELCPQNAVKYNKPLLYGIVHKLSERKN